MYIAKAETSYIATAESSYNNGIITIIYTQT